MATAAGETNLCMVIPEIAHFLLDIGNKYAFYFVAWLTSNSGRVKWTFVPSFQSWTTASDIGKSKSLFKNSLLNVKLGIDLNAI